jgi:hypothetical protein
LSSIFIFSRSLHREENLKMNNFLQSSLFKT